MKMLILVTMSFFFGLKADAQQHGSSRHIKISKEGMLMYQPDENGNIIPDFSKVGYAAGEKDIPIVPVVTTVEPAGTNSEVVIQNAIDQLSKLPLDANGFRGAVLLKKGTYPIKGIIKISASGIVLRGEGEQTKLVATGNQKRSLIQVSGVGVLEEIPNTRRKIVDRFVPVGAKSFTVSSTTGLKVGDSIVVFRPGVSKWISDLKMNAISAKENTIQWQPQEYDLHFERIVTAISKNRIFIDNPIVMAMEDKYGSGEIYQYRFDGRISNIGIENLLCESEYTNEEDESHGWNAVYFDKVENSWVKKITAKYFGYSCVNLSDESRNITVDSCLSLSPVSIIMGGRRYSFNNDGQLNLVKNCFASEGRHDYVTGKKTRGPNVFYNCRSENAKSDIGPHHRWSIGTLYDNIVTDGEINIQDRGNWGTGHGWAGVTQVIWNCVANKAAVQDPWVSGKNYVVGLKATRVEGRLKGRPQTDWEERASPASLYLAQIKDKLTTTNIKK